VRRPFYVYAVVVVVAACSTFDSSNETPSGDDAGARDGGATGEDSSPNDATVDASGVTSLVHDDFESSMGLNCAGWATGSGTAFPEVGSARSGVRSCRLCVPDVEGHMEKIVSTDGGIITAVAYARFPDDAGVDGAVFMSIQAYDSMSNASGFETASRDPTSAWQPIQVVLHPMPATSTLQVSIGLRQPGCILVDDIDLTRE